MGYFIAAVSNEGGAPEQTYRKMQSAGACDDKPLSEMFKFEVPSLMVGTLDSLMNLSDDLVKSDQIIESIVRKVEKNAMELLGGKKSAELLVGSVPPNRYIQQFAWDYAKYPNRRPLKELVSLIGGGASAIEEELKQLSGSFEEKTIALQDAKRRQGGNLMVADLNDALTAADLKNIKIHDTEYLKTLFVAMPIGMKETFESSVYSLGGNLVGYGGPDWSSSPANLGQATQFGTEIDRQRKRGSPVVPGSLVEVKKDKESILYSLTILKSQYQAGRYEGDEFMAGNTVDFVSHFNKICKDKRYVVREVDFDPSQASRSAMALEQLTVEVDSMRSGLTRWCKTHYGEAFVAWMHIKVIRIFVESVLRYGLPVDFTAVLYKVIPNKDDQLTKALDEALSNKKDAADEDDVEEGDEYHDFVLIKFDIQAGY